MPKEVTKNSEQKPVIPYTYKTLTCTLNESNELMNSKQVAAINFKNNILYMYKCS